MEAEPFHIMIRKRMIDLKLRQHQLAQQTGISQNALSRILNGRQPSWESASKLMAALDLRIAPQTETQQ